MRKQYHLRRSTTGYDAWDVDRLIELVADLPVERLPLAEVTELDETYWFDDSGERATIRKVVEHLVLVTEADPTFPVILDPDGRVMDGMHRVARALLDGRPDVPAVRLRELPAPDHPNCRPEDLSYER